ATKILRSAYGIIRFSRSDLHTHNEDWLTRVGVALDVDNQIRSFNLGQRNLDPSARLDFQVEPALRSIQNHSPEALLPFNQGSGAHLCFLSRETPEVSLLHKRAIQSRGGNLQRVAHWNPILHIQQHRELSAESLAVVQ